MVDCLLPPPSSVYFALRANDHVRRFLIFFLLQIFIYIILINVTCVNEHATASTFLDTVILASFAGVRFEDTQNESYKLVAFLG